MKIATKKISAALAISSVFFLGACGGGGGSTAGGGGGGTSTGGTTTASSITSTNVRDVSAQAVSAIDGLNGQMNTAASANVLVIGVDTDTAGSGLLGASMRQLYLALDAQSASNLATGATTTLTEQCPDGGSLTVIASLAAAGKVSNGDSLSITASNCVVGGQKMNGGLSFSFSNMTGTAGASTVWSATITLRFTTLSIETAGEAVRANGDLTVSYSQTGINKASYSTNGNSLQMVLVKNSVTTDRTLSAFSYTGSVNGSTYTYSSNFTFAGNFPKLGNTSFTVKTNTPFSKNGAAFPHAGSLTVTATDKSTATLTALDSTNVKIELDKTGDGTVDETINTTWTALKSLL